MEIQSSLFESTQQEGGFVPSRKRIGPRPMVLKSMEILTKNVPDIPHKEEVDRLMQATINRMYIPRSEYLEYIEVSKLLITASEKFRMTISNVVDGALELMRKLPNLYSNQAIFMSLEEPIYGFAIKKSIANTVVRRMICRK
jgi:hypothetical protein